MRALPGHGANNGRATIPGRQGSLESQTTFAERENMARRNARPPKSRGEQREGDHSWSPRISRITNDLRRARKHGAQECAPSQVTGRTTGGRPFLVAGISRIANDLRRTRKHGAQREGANVYRATYSTHRTNRTNSCRHTRRRFALPLARTCCPWSKELERRQAPVSMGGPRCR